MADTSQVVKHLQAIRAGDAAARESLIRQYQVFVLRIACRTCSKHLTYHDDEYSISLLAFNQAIDSYQPQYGTSFESYASLLIRRRLIDHLRQEQRHRYVTLENDDDETAEIHPAEVRQARLEAQRQDTALDLREEIHSYRAALAEFGLDLPDLVEATPKHRTTRERLQWVAKMLAQDERLYGKLIRTRQLPIRELQALTGLSRKVLENGRRYIIGIAVVLGGSFEGMRGYLDI